MTEPMSPEDDALADDLREFFRSGGRASDAAKATAKDLFGLRNVEDQVAALAEHDDVGRPIDPALLGVRGPGDGLEFRFGDVTVLASAEPGRLHLIVRSDGDPSDVTVAIESPAGTEPVTLDAAGGASVSAAGVVRVRISRPGLADTVTDPIAIPPA